MDEQQWMTSESPEAMVAHLREAGYAAGLMGKKHAPGAVPNSKLRLWVEACRREEERVKGSRVYLEPGRGYDLDSPDGFGQAVATWSQRRDNYTVPARVRSTLLRDVANPFRPASLLRSAMGEDGRCSCDCAAACPLGRTGSAERCRRYELAAAGVDLTAPSWLTPQVLDLARAANGGLPCGGCDGKGLVVVADDPDDEARRRHSGTGGYTTISMPLYRHKDCRECNGKGRLPGERLDPLTLNALGDALEEAGCQDEWLVNHLHGLQPFYKDGRLVCWNRPDKLVHVRGCWAVELILGEDRG